MSRVRIIVLSVGLFILSLGVALVAFNERKKTKPEAGSAEQLEKARKVKAKKAEEKKTLEADQLADDLKEAERLANEEKDIKPIEDNGSKEE